MATGQEVALRQYEDVRKWFSDPNVQRQLALVVPSHLNMTKLLNDAFQLIKGNDYLLKCSKRSLIAGIMAMAELGLSARKELGQAHLVPFKNTKTGELDATLIIGYRGYIVLAKNTGEIGKVSAHAVYSNDQFSVKYGTDEYLHHEPAEGARGDFKGAYCVFFYKDGQTSFEYMKKERIDAVRARSKAKDEGPWQTDYEEMAVKTVIRHHAKYAPLSTERMARAAELEDRYLEGMPQADLLPEVSEKGIPETVSPTQAPSPEASRFDLLVTEFIKNNYSGPGAASFPADAVNKFVEYVSQKNNVTVEALKADAVKRWDAFSLALKKNLDSLASKPSAPPPSSPPQPTVHKGRPRKVEQPPVEQESVSPPSPEQPTLIGGDKESTITCPNTDTSVPKSNCDKCPDMEGCRAYS